MLRWHKRLQEILAEVFMNLTMYSRNVNDTNIVVRTPLQDDIDDQETKAMESIQQTANSIHQIIEIMIDYPSKHPNNRLLVLDAKFWLETKNGKVISLIRIIPNSWSPKTLFTKMQRFRTTQSSTF